MASLRSLIIKISANSTSFQTEIARAARMGGDFYKTIGDGSRKAAAANRQTQRSIADLNSELASIKSSASGLAGAWAGVFATHQLIDFSDTWNQMNGRLKLASTSMNDFTDAQRSLMELSQRTGTSLEANTNLYSRIAQSLRSAGYASSDVANLTETVATSLKLSGASTEEASSVITQLSQALGSGVLRGEEFNAIMENGGRLAKLLADGLGTTIGGLRNLANSGQLTTDKIVPLLTNVQVLRDEFQSLPASISGSAQKVQNAFIAWVGSANNAVGASSSLSVILDSVASNINTVANAAGALVAVGLARYFGNMVGSVISSTRAVIANSQAEIGLAQAQVRGAQVSVAVARAAVYRAEQARAAAVGIDAQAAAELRLNAAQNGLDKAIAGRAGAVANLTQTTSVMARLGSGVLGILGGWPGLIIGAGTAMYALYQNTQQAHKEAVDYANNINEIKSNLEKMSVLGLKSASGDARNSIKAQNEELRDLDNQIAKVKGNLAGLDKIQKDYNKSPTLTYLNTFYDQADITRENIELTDKLNKLEFNRETLTKKISATQSLANEASDLAEKKAINQTNAIVMLNGAYELLDKTLNKRKNDTFQGLVIKDDKLTPQQSSAIEKARREYELAGLDNSEKQHRQFEYEAKDLGLTGAIYTRYIYQKTEAARKNSAFADSTKGISKSQNEAAKQAENYARKIADLSVAIEVQKVRSKEGERASELYAASHQDGARWTNEQREAIQKNAKALAEWTQLADDNVKKHRDQVEAIKSLTDAARKYSDEAVKTTSTSYLSDRGRNYYDEKQQVERDFDKTDKSTTAIEARKKALDELNRKYTAISEAESNWQAGVSHGLANWVDTNANYASQAADAVGSAMDGMVNSITDMLNNNKSSWRDWGITVLKTIEQVVVNATIANGIKSLGRSLSGASGWAGTIGSLLSGVTKNAKGGVYESPSLSSYSGHVYSSPKTFAFAKGAGIFAEAGPEAIMPLTRSKDGSLGVRAIAPSTGNSGGVNLGSISVNFYGSNQQGSAGNDAGNGIGKQIQQAVVNTINDQASRQGTPLWRAINKR